MGTGYIRYKVKNKSRKRGSTADRLLASAGAGIYETAVAVMADSKANYVPVETAALQATGRVEALESGARGVRVEMQYGGGKVDYALIVHERGDVYHPHGQWKYLETPAQAAGLLIGRNVAAATRKEFG
jgi:hypothetical protein